ncbi:zf-HC2 domain-containing protein [bacterium]|nr:zf-HC2 domain-containing protein [bacterium]
MKCASYITILKYLDGLLGEKENAAFRDHLGHCTRCSEKVKFLDELKQSLVIKPLSGDNSIDACPDEELLGAFLENKLQAAEEKEIAGHLLSCPQCLDKLFAVRSAVYDQKAGLRGTPQGLINQVGGPSPGLVFSVKEWVAQFYPNIRGWKLAEVFAGTVIICLLIAIVIISYIAESFTDLQLEYRSAPNRPRILADYQAQTSEQLDNIYVGILEVSPELLRLLAGESLPGQDVIADLIKVQDDDFPAERVTSLLINRELWARFRPTEPDLGADEIAKMEAPQPQMAMKGREDLSEAAERDYPVMASAEERVEIVQQKKSMLLYDEDVALSDDGKGKISESETLAGQEAVLSEPKVFVASPGDSALRSPVRVRVILSGDGQLRLIPLPSKP